MKFRLILCVLIVCPFLGGAALSQKPASGAVRSEQPVLDFCDVVRDPAKYDGKVVRVRGIYRYSFEVSELAGAGCLGKARRAWVSQGDASCPNSKSIGGEEFYGRLVDIVAVGKFSSTGGHFGHLGEYPFQLQITCVESATVMPERPSRPVGR